MPAIAHDNPRSRTAAAEGACCHHGLQMCCPVRDGMLLVAIFFGIWDEPYLLFRVVEQGGHRRPRPVDVIHCKPMNPVLTQGL